MTKKIGITCDDYKADKFRKWLLKDGYKLEYDGESGIPNVHLFRIECEEKDFGRMQHKIKTSLQHYEIKFKQSN